MKNQRKCSKKFEGLSHAEEFSLFGHQMVESQDNLKECEGLLDQFLEHYAAAIAQHNAAIAQEALGSPCGDDDEARVRRRQRGGRVLVRPPSSRMGPLADAERAALLKEDLLYARYRDAHDPVSAHEVLSQRAAAAVAPEHPRASTPPPAIRVPPEDAPVSRPAPRGRQRESAGEALVKSVARAVGSSLGRSIVRGVLGSILRGR